MVSRHRIGLTLTAALLASRCGGAAPKPPEIPADPASYANVAAFVATHLSLDLTPDFNTRTMAGIASLTFERRDPAAREVVLDTRDLHISKAEAGTNEANWAGTTFTLDPATAAFGSALRIAMPPEANSVRVTYTTSPGAKGLQWLTPAQTAGKTHPFLFTQAEAIQARSFVPIQDLPGVRLRYDATIHTPADLVAVMAAEMEDAPGGAHGTFKFHMPLPIPSYLIALAVGDLKFREMSERTGVWAEPSVVDAAAREFEDTEKMIQATEQVYGKYQWGRYDLLVLPPSFPFGGMENPRLTFATPTVIAGDKSLVSLVAHELAHSWSGNLATNATWTDFWLNEGVTTYLERRIVEAVYGRRLADMEAVIGFKDLEESRKTLDTPGDRTLLPDLAGRDPDDAYSSVPYEQGALFLSFLEAKFGRDRFDEFLRRWFDDHQFQSVTTAQFVAFLKSTLMTESPNVVTDAQVQEWLHSETVPSFAILPKSDAFAKVEQASAIWQAGGLVEGLAATANGWTTQEWLHFLNSLPRKMNEALLTALDKQFNLTTSGNAEIAHAWYRLAIANHYTAAYPAMQQYMERIGRRKLIVPLYRDLAATPEGLALAKKIFATAREGYHPMAQDSIEAVLKK
ncbi:MAG TPA: M1 family metallopeptidase [Vicinamibacterales bacterium]|nr:M1 family metallopeptidase [Vicinamibacterales bacterium]